jgi:hypothetical protein
VSAPLRRKRLLSRLGRVPLYGLLVTSMLEGPLYAQARPDGPAGRPWLSAGLGGGLQELGCVGCARSGVIGGLALTAAAGVSLPRNTGAALAAYRFSEVSFEHSQQSLYLVVMGQYAPARARRLTIGAGLGHGSYWGDRNPYVHRGSGAVSAASIAFRAPAGSALALSISASYLAAVTGRRVEEDPSVSVRRPLRPRLALVAVSLSLAARSLVTQSGQRRELPTWR